MANSIFTLFFEKKLENVILLEPCSQSRKSRQKVACLHINWKNNNKTLD